MIDDKVKNSIIEKFEIASKEFNFRFISPYYMGENKELCFFGYLYRENTKKGVLVDIFFDLKDIDDEKRKYCNDNNLFHSCLYIDSLLGEYKSSYFKEMLKDWSTNLKN